MCGDKCLNTVSSLSRDGPALLLCRNGDCLVGALEIGLHHRRSTAARQAALDGLLEGQRSGAVPLTDTLQTPGEQTTLGAPARSRMKKHLHPQAEVGAPVKSRCALTQPGSNGAPTVRRIQRALPLTH